MKKIKKSTGITLAMAIFFFSLTALSLPVIEGELKRQFCLKMESFVSTWIEVAGAFAFSQGPINVAELAFFHKNDPILDAEVGNTGQRAEMVLAYEPELDATVSASDHQVAATQTTETCLASAPKRARKATARSRARGAVRLPMSTIAMAEILRSDSLARSETFMAFSAEKTEYIFRRVEAMKVARVFENVRVTLARRAAAMRLKAPAQPSLRTVVLTDSKRRLCPKESDETITTGPETSF